MNILKHRQVIGLGQRPASTADMPPDRCGRIGLGVGSIHRPGIRGNCAPIQLHGVERLGKLQKHLTCAYLVGPRAVGAFKQGVEAALQPQLVEFQFLNLLLQGGMLLPKFNMSLFQLNIPLPQFNMLLLPLRLALLKQRFEQYRIIR